MIITARVTKFAYMRFPTLNSETMKSITVQIRINRLFLKINGKLSMAGKEMLVSKKILQKHSEVKISIVTPIWRGKINQSIVNKKLKCKSHFGQQGKKEI